MLKPGARLNVFAIKRVAKEGVIWTKAGFAYINRDGSMNLKLHVLPMEGELHVRDEMETVKDFGKADTQRDPVANENPQPLEADAAASMGGH